MDRGALGQLKVAPAAVCKHLPPLRLNRLAKLAGLDPEQDCGLADLLPIYVAELLSRRIPLEAEQLELIVEKFGRPITEWATRTIGQLDQAPNTNRRLAACYLAILDGTWVMLSGQDRLLSLGDGRESPGPESPPLETVSYNLTGMLLALAEKVRAIVRHDRH